MDYVIGRYAWGVEDGRVPADAGFRVAVSVFGIEEFEAVVGSRFGRCSFDFGALVRLFNGLRGVFEGDYPLETWLR